jgi:hypothetical protein
MLLKKKKKAKETELFMVHYQLFQVLTAMFMKMQVLWDMTTWRLINIYRRFRVYAGGEFWGCRGPEDVGGVP